MTLILNVNDNISPTIKKLRLILGDQLNIQHSWFQQLSNDTLYLIAEIKAETRYVKHHIQKISAFFAAMHQFASELSSAGHQVMYLDLHQTQDFCTFPELLAALIHTHGFSEFEYLQPDEYRLAKQLNEFKNPKLINISSHETEHFFLGQHELAKYFKAGKAVKMEFFYRKMRKRFQVLMDHDQPIGGKWNYDHENRACLKKDELADIPEPKLFTNDVTTILTRLEQHQVPTFGTPAKQLIWPINRAQSKTLLDYFCRHLLANFGKFQDAMTSQSPHKWSLYHARLSFALNTKLLSPVEVVDTAIEHWSLNQAKISLAQIEGFLRQILGWREYIRGIYWMNMPTYANKNNLNAKRQLPDYFWTGETKMKCLNQAIGQSLDYAYAHHIQRLMITGNFCLIAGIDPDQVDAWYLGVYLDAIEWVEMPNTRGMALFADGGIIATKPYAASGSYVNKMSDYCKNCHYKVKHKIEVDACPLNSLYWRFVKNHENQFKQNPRMSMIYRSWDKMGAQKQQALLEKAEQVLGHLESL